MSIYKPKSRPHLKLVYNSELPKVEPVKREPIMKRPKNEDVRPREHLRPDEVERLIAAAKRRNVSPKCLLYLNQNPTSGFE